MSQRYLTYPWGPYCWDCGGAGFESIVDGAETCTSCQGTGRAAIPWSELFTHGGKHPPLAPQLFREERKVWTK